MEDNTQKQIRKKKRFKLKHPIRFIVIIYAFILAVLIGIIYFFPWMSDQMADVMIVEYGDLNSSQKQDFYFVKYETVYISDTNGRAGYTCSEGSMVRTGEEVVKLDKAKVEDNTDYSLYNARANSFADGDTLLGDIDSEEKESLIRKLEKRAKASESRGEKLRLDLAVESLTRKNAAGTGDDQKLKKNVLHSGLSGNYTVDTSGVISYKVDGYENALSPYTIKYLDKEKVKSVNDESVDLFDGTVTKGEPVCKIVNNREWYAVTWLNREEANNFEKGNVVTLKLDGGDMPGTVRSIKKQGRDYRIILKFDSYYKNVATLRREKCKVVTSNQRGLLVRKNFIKRKDGRQGVYLIDVTGETVFTPISIIAEDDRYALVKAGSFTENGKTVSTINVYDEIKK